MRNGTVFLKPIFFLPALALLAATFFTSCQKTSTTSTDIGDWADVAEIGSQPRTQPVSFIINNTLYVGLGFNGATNLRLRDFYKFDEPTLTATKVDSFPTNAASVSGAAGFSINGKGYVIGGFDGTYYSSHVFQFDPSQPAGSQWTQLADAPLSPRINAVGFNIGNIGYVGGGVDSTTYPSSEVWQFDGTTWSSTGGFKSARTGASAFVYNGLAYVVGGLGGNQQYIPDVSVYNPSTAKWTTRRNIINDGLDSAYEADYGNNITRNNSAIFLINDTAYLATGNFNGGILNTTWAYDITNDQWFQKTSFEGTAREGAIGFSINNHGYVGLGDNGGNYYNDVWEFFPDAAQTNSNNYP